MEVDLRHSLLNEGENRKIVTYHNGVKCDLDDLNTHKCEQIYDIYVRSFTGIIGKVAQLDVTYYSECKGMGAYYLANAN